MQTIELKKYPEIKRVILAADPSYKKHSAFVSIATAVTLSGTYWDGGSRDTYTAVNLANFTRNTSPQFAPPQFGGPREAPRIELPDDVVIVRTGTFCGKKATAHVYVKAFNVTKLLPDFTE